MHVEVIVKLLLDAIDNNPGKNGQQGLVVQHGGGQGRGGVLPYLSRTARRRSRRSCN